MCWMLSFQQQKPGGNRRKMSTNLLALVLFVLVAGTIVTGCLITNCPRGGKRSGKFLSESNVKPCISCGPGRTGQCYGPNICCGPFGCLLGTPETVRCQKEGFFHEREPCIAGTGFCRRNTGRCAADGICCNQDSCYVDRTCAVDKQEMSSMDIYNLINYPNPLEYGEN